MPTSENGDHRPLTREELQKLAALLTHQQDEMGAIFRDHWEHLPTSDFPGAMAELSFMTATHMRRLGDGNIAVLLAMSRFGFSVLALERIERELEQVEA